MKKIKGIINPFKLDEVKDALNDIQGNRISSAEQNMLTDPEFVIVLKPHNWLILYIEKQWSPTSWIH